MPKAKSRPKRRTVLDEHVSYLIRVTDWDYYYSLRPGDLKSRWDNDAYNELATVSFSGELLRPEGMEYVRASVTLSAQQGLTGLSVSAAPGSLGTLSARSDELSAYIFVPVERFAELCSVAQSGRVQEISITGTRLRYRSGLVHSLSIN